MVTALEIDRGQWLTGAALKALLDQNIGSTLRDGKSGLMCCLGFYGKACGLTDTEIIGQPTICAMMKQPAETGWLSVDAASKDRLKDAAIRAVEYALTHTNDKMKGIHPTRREARIKKLFKKYGNIDVTFVGKYADATRKAKAVKHDG